MEEPEALASALTEFLRRHEPGTRMHAIGADLLRASNRNRHRRAAVLKHEDLAKRVAAVLGLRRAEQWTGYLPPAVAIDDSGETLRQIISMKKGQERVFLNPARRSSCGEVLNNSPERAELVAISLEALEREKRAAAQSKDDPK